MTKPEEILEKNWDEIARTPYKDMNMSHFKCVITSMREHSQIFNSETNVKLDDVSAKLKMCIEALTNCEKAIDPKSPLGMQVKLTLERCQK